MSGHSVDRLLGKRDGLRWTITWLHNRAASMNDPKAKAILNSAASRLGIEIREGRIPPMPDSTPERAADPSPEVWAAAHKIAAEIDVEHDDTMQDKCRVCQRVIPFIVRALDAFRREGLERERENASALRHAAETIRSGIFYWMTRNHNRGEKSYSKLGEAKEQLTAAIKAYDDEAQQ